MHSTRYAHSEGYTDICFTENGKWLTTGEDGDVRIWNGFDDIDSKSIRVGEKCFAVACKSNKIYVADELNELKKYDLETNEFEGVITSFTLPITCISVNKSNTHLLCGSSDFEIHLIALSNLKVTTFSGHDAPILSLCYDPLEKYFISSSCDGTCRFWSIQNLNTVKTLSNLHPKSNDFNDSVSWCKVAWHKDGGLIGIPCEKEIHFYERETWICKFKINLSNENTSDEFNSSIVLFSPDGRYVLSSTNTQLVCIHSIINKSLVFKYSYKKNLKICSLAWNPSNQEEIIFCDINGNMGIIKPTFKDDSSKTSIDTLSNSKKTTSKKEMHDDLQMEDLLDLLEQDDDNTNDSSEPKKTKTKKKDEIKSPSKKRKRLSDDENSEKTTGLKNNDSDDQTIEDEEICDDGDDVESLEKIKAFKPTKKEFNLMDDDKEVGYEKASGFNEKEYSKPTKVLQAPFQPSSTSLSLPERYMVWNSVGLITQFNKQGDDSIDIEFHNASYHHTIHMKNQFDYTMADMSKEVIVLASPGHSKDDQENELLSIKSSSNNSQSKLTCIMLNSNDSSKEWSIDMLRKEYIRCVCASKHFIACATSRKFLRVFCIAGTQNEIIQIPGIPLCMSANENCIFIAYHISDISTGYSIFHLNNDTHHKRETENGVIPLSDNDAKLEWLGFSDEGNPFCYDSNGYLFSKCLTVSDTAWTPISFLRSGLNHKSDNYWVVGIAERNQMIKAILCKSSKFPQVLPRPNISMINVSIPLCDPDSEKTQLEQNYWKNKYFSLSMLKYDSSTSNIDFDQDELQDTVDKFESSSTEFLMKLFMLACKTFKEQRAYEIAFFMDKDALQLAIKYATKTRALVLAQNLNLLAEKKAQFEFQNFIQESQVKENKTQRSTFAELSKYPVSNDGIMSEDIIIESSTFSNTNTSIITQSSKEKDLILEKNDISNSIEIDSSLKSCLTPTSIPLTNTRLNPFCRNTPSNAKPSPLNDSSKSVINEIEEKLNRQSANKDVWKPTPPSKKLSKSKVTTPNSAINSFFSKN